MLQRQIMIKHLQELQRRQQLQELGNTRNQNYANQQLSSLKNTLAGQFPTTVNGTPLQDSSRMFLAGNMQITQHGEPNGLGSSQSHNHALGPTGPDASFYGAYAPNMDKNWNQYSHIQGPSSLSVQPSAFGSSLMNQRCGFSSDRISVVDGSWMSGQEKDLFGRVPVEGYNSGVLSVNYSEQGITMQRNPSNTESEGQKTSKHGQSETTDSLDPLEQKILYNMDDDGSWSALMQSALAETSSSDNGVQEEWSGLSFQNPEPLNDNQSLDFIDSEKLQNNWVDRNSQNASYCNFGTQRKPPTGGSQPIQTSLPSILPCNDDESHSNFSGREFEGSFWLQGSTSYHVHGGIQKPSDQGPNAMSLSSHNVNDYMKNPCQTATEFPIYAAAASVENSVRKIPNSSGQEFPLFENMPVNQPSLTSNMLQQIGFPMGLPTSWQSVATHQNASSSGAPNELHNPSPFRHEHNVQEFSKYSGKSERLEKGSFLHQGSTDMNNPTSLSSSQKQEFTRTDHLEVDAVGSSLLIEVPARDVGFVGPSSSQNYDSTSYQRSIANAREMFLTGQKFGIREKSEPNDQLGRASSTGYHQNFQQMTMFCQNDTVNHPVAGNEASNLTYQSQISLQMAPSWFKRFGQPFSTAVTSVASKQLNPGCILPSNVTYQNLAVPLPKKRKLVALDMIPWHKEVNCEQSRLQDISSAELAWAQASNRRQDEVIKETEVVEELLPVIRAKRRLICMTQLMQQVFRPAPAIILRSDASSNCDYVIYFAARLALRDACGSTTQLPSHIDDVSLEKVTTSKRANASDFSKVVEGFISRVKKLEDDLSRLEKTLSLADVKVESQELEKFSLINRFAKFHIKAHPTKHDPVSSSTSHKNNLQKYVIGLPMPKTVPEVIDCLSL